MSTFLELKDELSDRGFAHLSSSRRGQIINDACSELDELFLWPYRESSAQGVAPLTVATLGVIEVVSNETQGYLLEPRTYQWVTENASDLGDVSSPAFFYVAWPSGSPVVVTYPTSGDTIGVQFWKITPTLSATTDLPLAPARYHSIITLIAQRMAESERGNLAQAQGIQSEIDRQVGRMMDNLLGGQQVAGPSDFTRVVSAEDA